VKKEVRKKVETVEKYRDTQREKGNSKIVGNSPWGPKKGPKKGLKKSIRDVCCKYGDKKERAKARGGPKNGCIRSWETSSAATCPRGDWYFIAYFWRQDVGEERSSSS